MLTFTIQQNTDNFFDGCDSTALENVDQSATIQKIQDAVEARILGVYPDASVEFEGGTRTRIFIDEDGNETSRDDEQWIRTVIDDEFARQENWITA